MYNQIEEIRRGVFSLPSGLPLDELRKHFPKYSKFLIEEGTVQVSPHLVNDIAEALRRNGFEVRTLRDAIAEISKYTLLPLPDSRFTSLPLPHDVPLDESTEIKAFSYTTRRLRKLKVMTAGQNTNCILVRLGQPVIVQTNKQFRKAYIAGDNELRPVTNVQEVLENAHRASRSVEVFFVLKGDYLFLYRPIIYLPPKHYDLLYRKMGIFVGPDWRKTFSERDAACLSSADLQLVKDILGSLNIILTQGEPPELRYRRGLEVVESASQVLKDSYWNLFSSQDEAAESVAVIRHCRWERVSKQELADALSSLSNNAFDGDQLSSKLLDYFQENLPVIVNYKAFREAGVDSTLRGLTIEQFPVFGHEEKNFYLCALPDLHLLLQIATTRHLGGQGKGATSWLADQWHAYPYFGRFKFTSFTNIDKERASIEDVIEMFISRSFGIPSIEQKLAEDVYLASYFQDRNPQHWAGALEFTRYFSSFGKLLVRQTGEMDVPCALMEDVTGKPFFLRYGVANYLAQETEINFGQEGRWKRFVAASFLMNKLKDPGSIPVFDLIPGVRPKDVGWDAVLDGMVLALAKYEGFTTLELSKANLRHDDIIRRDLEPSFDRAVRHKQLSKMGTKYYYNLGSYKDKAICLKEEDELKNKEDNIDGVAAIFSTFSSIIHPLAFGSSLVYTAQKRRTEALLEEARKRIKRPYDYFRPLPTDVIRNATAAFKDRGVVHLRGPQNKSDVIINSFLGVLSRATADHEIRIARKNHKDITELIFWSERILWRSHIAHSLGKKGWKISITDNMNHRN